MIIKEYRIDYKLITPSGKEWDSTTCMTSNGLPIRTLECAENCRHHVTSYYIAEGYKILSSKIMFRTITYSDWNEEV